jgi:hypothetical protein
VTERDVTYRRLQYQNVDHGKGKLFWRRYRNSVVPKSQEMNGGARGSAEVQVRGIIGE